MALGAVAAAVAINAHRDGHAPGARNHAAQLVTQFHFAGGGYNEIGQVMKTFRLFSLRLRAIVAGDLDERLQPTT